MTNERFIDAALRPLIVAFEQIAIQNMAMKEMLDKAETSDWKIQLLSSLNTPATDAVRERFAKLYASLDQEDRAYDAIQEFLDIRHTT